jgi:hypothetical protein
MERTGVDNAERQGQVPRRARPARWVAAAVLGAAFMLWLVLFAPRLLIPAASQASLRDVTDAAKRHELQDSRLKLQNDVRTTLLQGLGGLAVLVGVFFTYRQVQMSRRQLEHTIESNRQQHELDRQGQVTERFTRAIDQLGSAQLDIRLGGIYALERIARDSDTDRPTIRDILTAYIRQHSPWPPSQSGQYKSDWPLVQQPDLRTRAPDVQAALTVLSRIRLSVDLHEVDLRKAFLGGEYLLWLGSGHATHAAQARRTVDSAAPAHASPRAAGQGSAAVHAACLIQPALSECCETGYGGWSCWSCWVSRRAASCSIGPCGW